MLVLVAAGLAEIAVRARGRRAALPVAAVLPALPVLGGLGAVAWVAFKVGRSRTGAAS
ncbi:hypothetical protein ACFQ0M_13280 [Kitasatospora aburaviensis]